MKHIFFLAKYFDQIHNVIIKNNLAGRKLRITFTAEDYFTPLDT